MSEHLHIERYYPPHERTSEPIQAPISQVTLLEDRAMVRRIYKGTVYKGIRHLRIDNVAPTLQDVSLKVDVLSVSPSPNHAANLVRVVDVRARRAMRILEIAQNESTKELEKQILETSRQLQYAAEDTQSLQQQLQRLTTLTAQSLEEIAVDVAFGNFTPSQWNDGVQAMFARARLLREEQLNRLFAFKDSENKLQKLVLERQAFDRIESAFSCWIELDVQCNIETDGPLEVELAIEYVVPNALWRPMHTARLIQESTLSLTSHAAVWQYTGEDWVDVDLVFSTARSSLGVEPPKLNDDLLRAQRKNEQVHLETRDVVVQRAQVSAAASQGVELPGVDDGGSIQTIRARAKHTVRSNGRFNVVDLFTMQTECQSERIGIPELDARIFHRTTHINRGSYPLLAGPVELAKDAGYVGWTQLEFVAPGETFELSFGPDDAFRMQRAEYSSQRIRDDKWHESTREVSVFVSHIGTDHRMVQISERVPVSEVPQVKIEIVQENSTPFANVDEPNGFFHWKLSTQSTRLHVVRFVYRVLTAPGVPPVA